MFFLPFKFHRMWLEDKYLCSMIRKKWITISISNESSAMEKLVYKLKCLRNIVVLWENGEETKIFS